ncbi:TonB-dependent receptor [Arenimonas sp.]|uniref:TonB-dependent receptor n=1 Tax=Arenimonas sp. TaxID=1872635 RepID=UPI002E2F11D1|nr:TonB-dependent receptor [Arenimonas sp.]HEX4853437.1 TonB-dependent receptor [Arenimonas sp.]
MATAIVLAISGTAWAQTPPEETAPMLDEITVTAQKRSENLQKVPISIQVLGTEQLDDLHVADFEDIATQFPSVSFQRLGEVPSNFQVYMRGVASGGDGNHSGPLPSVGVYVDEQPVTTIRGAIDVHPYDIQRVEALAGPQGTLYGASSQAGTVRIITNKPDASGITSGYGLELNAIEDGGTGHVAEGFINLPISERAAIRLVGWDRDDAGYIDNEFGERTFPTSGITINNGALARDDYNTSDTTGARAALKIDLTENWTITPSVMSQRQDINGSFGVDPDVGELSTRQFYPQTSEDRWTQSALTVQGKIGNFDVTYAFAHLDRDLDTESDYNDYAYWYDTLFGYGTYFYDDNGDLINPSQYIQATNGYKKRSHELRVASPSDRRFRFVAGVFWQDQDNDIQERYRVDGLADVLSVTGWEDTIWLTRQQREDRDQAVFGEMSYDITDRLTATAGMRFFEVDNSLRGFFGFSDGYSSNPTYGEGACNTQSLPPYPNAPCEVFNKRVKENDSIGKFNLSYEFSDDAMVYGTWSEGYRPGGINRRGTLDPYLSDYLTNFELGWKTRWADGRLTFNGAVFRQDWEDFQFAILGQNGLTEIKNANQARISGIEADISWAVNYNLRISGGLAFYDAELTENYCGFTDANGNPETDCPTPEAPSGTRLPITADFKGNLTARYTFDVGEYEAHVQGQVRHEGKRSTDLRTEERGILGDLDAYTLFDLTAGFGRGNWAVDFYIRNVFDERAQQSRFTQCAEAVCGEQAYTVVARPRTFGVRFSQDF